MVLTSAISGKADGFSYNGLNYAITSSSTVAVGYNPNISGSIVIPIVAHHIYTTTSNGVTVQHDDAYTVTGIGTSGFNGSSGLTSIIIPNTVTYIGVSAFQNCTGLTRIDIPNSVITIGDYAFWLCHNLTSVTIPNSVTSIGNGAFHSCRALTYIDIPNSVTKISDGMFYWCSNLTSITIPNSVTYIGNHAFKDCTSLARVNITDVAAWCNIDFRNDQSHTGLSNPLSYAHHLYLKDEEVTDLVIPETVTTIKDYVFLDCTGLTSVTIPDSVTFIGSYAFSGCSGLTDIFSKIKKPQDVTYGSYVFNKVDKKNCKVYIPKGTLEIYKATAPWKDFYNFIEEDDVVTGDLDDSGIVDVDDVNALINIVLGFQSQNDLPCNADLDGSGIVDVDDVNALINIILKL